jgi:hypothetical protein
VSKPAYQFTARSLLTHYGSHPLVLDLYFLKSFGPEYYTWEPETLWSEVLRISGAPNISEVNRNRIQAVRTVHLTSTVFERWEVFEKVVMALNGVIPRFDMMQKPDLGQLLLGVGSILKLRSGKFSDEIARYVAAALQTDGIVYAPALLKFCNVHLKKGNEELHRKTVYAIKSGQPPEDEGVIVQLSRIDEAKLYTAVAAKKLLEQLRLVRESAVGQEES